MYVRVYIHGYTMYIQMNLRTYMYVRVYIRGYSYVYEVTDKMKSVSNDLVEYVYQMILYIYVYVLNTYVYVLNT